jgi:hypothetical protein
LPNKSNSAAPFSGVGIASLVVSPPEIGIVKDLAAQTAGGADGPWQSANSPAFVISEDCLAQPYFEGVRLPFNGRDFIA